MSSAFSIALSALQAQSEAIDTTGNNLANMNTTGFKGSSVDFEDLMSQYMGVGSGMAVGTGVARPINQQLFTQGPLESSSSSLATAIEGNGFFVVVDPSSGAQEYTRDGNFTISNTGILQSQTGENVQGWVVAPNGTINTSTAPGNIALPVGAVLPPQTTQNVSLAANLDSTTPAGNSWSTTLNIVDSLGNMHTLTFNFTNVSGQPNGGGGTYPANTWQYNVTIPNSDISGALPPTGSTALTAPGTVTFNNSGQILDLNGAAFGAGNSSVTLNLPAGDSLSDSATLGDSTNHQIAWSLADSNGAGLITQYGTASGVSSFQQDGSQAAQLTSVAIQNGGQVVATFSNGKQMVEAQLALASIQNPDSLVNVGNNNFAATASTSAPAIGLPQTGGRGQILGGQLEGSNVDMATEFTDLITYQSGYQASSRVITTVDQMTQDLMNLIR
jgi:flagellar hook protein FlgE